MLTAILVTNIAIIVILVAQSVGSILYVRASRARSIIDQEAHERWMASMGAGPPTPGAPASPRPPVPVRIVRRDS